MTDETEQFDSTELMMISLVLSQNADQYESQRSNLLKLSEKARQMVGE